MLIILVIKSQSRGNLQCFMVTRNLIKINSVCIYVLLHRNDRVIKRRFLRIKADDTSKKSQKKCYRNITLHKIVHKVNDVVFLLLSKDLCVVLLHE